MKKDAVKLTPNPRLISIDGPDGAGKSTLARILPDLIGPSGVVVVRPTCFHGSAGAIKCGRRFKAAGSNVARGSQPHNAFFLDPMEANFADTIVSGLNSGALVILDSSEIRALAFVLDSCDDSAVQDTKRRIASGELTCGLKPLVRIILDGSANDLWMNLKTKESLDIGDPQDVQAVYRRKAAYAEAVKFVRENGSAAETLWINIDVIHSRLSLQEYFARIFREVIQDHLGQIV